MSMAAIDRALALDVTRMERLILVVIAKYADGNGHNAYPSVGLMAWHSGYSDRQVRRIVDGLVDQKILRVEEEGGGRGNATLYSFDLTAGTLMPAYKRKNHDTMTRNGPPNTVIADANHDIVSTNGHLNHATVSTFADNHDNMAGLSAAETMTFPPVNHDISELNHDISDVNHDIAMSPQSTLKDLKEPERESARESDVDSACPSLSLTSLDSFGITIYEEIFRRTLTPSERAYIVTNVSDAEQWRKVCQDWQVNRYKATNLTGLVDRYSRQGDALNVPGARPPVAAWDETSQRREPQPGDVPPEVIAAARKLRAELDQRQDAGSPMIDQAALAALKARQSGPVLKSFPKERAFEWRTT